jgi:hypothetical protein
MKKRYEGLVDALKIVAMLLFIFGAIGAVIAGYSIYGFGSAVALGVSTIVTTLLFHAVAAIIDLLASIELNTRTAATYFEKRIQPVETPERTTTLTKRKSE